MKSWPYFLIILGARTGSLLLGESLAPPPGQNTPSAITQPQPAPASSPSPPLPTRRIDIDLGTLPRQAFGRSGPGTEPQPLWTLKHTSPLGHPDISPDGRWLVITRTGDGSRYGGRLILVDLLNRKAADYPAPAPGLVNHAIFSRDGRELLGIVNTPAGYGFARWPLPAMTVTVEPLAAGEAIAAAFTHAQDQAVIMRLDGGIGVFNLAAKTKRFDVDFQLGKTNFYSAALAISPDDRFVSSGVIHPGNLYVRWSLADGTRVATAAPEGHLSWGRPAITANDGQTIFVAAHHELLALNSATGGRRATYPGNGLNTLHYQPTVDLAAAAVGQGETFALIDGTTGQVRFTAKHAVNPPAQYGYANWAAVAPDGKTAYSADYSSIKAWDLSSLNSLAAGNLFGARANHTLLPAARGNAFILVGDRLSRWDLDTRRLAPLPSPSVPAVSPSPDRETAPADQKPAAVWRSGESLHTLRLDGQGAQIYDLTNGQAVLRLGLTRSQAASTPPGPDASTKPIWFTGRDVPRNWPDTFPYEGGYFQADASPDAKRLVVTTWGGTLRRTTLWDLNTGRRLAVLADRSIKARLAGFSADGNQVVIVSEAGGVAVIRLHPGKDPTLDLVRAPSTDTGDRTTPSAFLMPSPDRLYLGTTAGTLESWRRESDGWRLRFEHTITDTQNSAQLPASILRLAASPSGRTLAVAVAPAPLNGSILMLDTETGVPRAHFDDTVSDLLFVTEDTLATTSVRLWNLKKTPDP